MFAVCLPACADKALGNEQTHLPRRGSVSMGTSWLQKEERWRRCVGGLIHRDNRAAEGRHNDVTPPLSVDAVWLNSGCLRYLRNVFFFFFCAAGEKSFIVETRTTHRTVLRRRSSVSLVFELAEICIGATHQYSSAHWDSKTDII